MFPAVRLPMSSQDYDDRQHGYFKQIMHGLELQETSSQNYHDL